MAAPVTIPFRMARGMIVVEATVAGSDRPLQFIVDSGAGESVVAKQTAEALGLETSSGTERIRTVHGTATAGRAATTALRLGPGSRAMTFSIRPLVMDLSRESRLLGSPLDGLIGMDFFAGRAVQIDFKASCLRLSPDGQPDPHATRLPLSRSDDGLLGTALLSRFESVWIDSGKRRIVFDPIDT